MIRKYKITTIATRFKEILMSFSKSNKYQISESTKIKILTSITSLSDSTRIEFKENGKFVAEFKLREFPGCCGIVILYNVYVNSKYQQNGIGTQIFEFAKEIAKKLGYSKIICTDIENFPSEKILLKLGYRHIDKFLNKRTYNKVNITVFDL